MRLAAVRRSGLGVLIAVGLVCGCRAVEPERKLTHPETSDFADKPTAPPRQSVTVFLTGNELSSLQPCGCSGGQLGGLDRRATVLNTVQSDKRLIINTGNLIDKESQQDLIKFNIIMQAFSLLDYDLVNLTEKDVGIAENLGLLSGNSFRIISSYHTADVNIPNKFTKKFKLDKTGVVVTVATLANESAQAEKIKQLFGPRRGKTTNILILNSYDKNNISEIADMGVVDVVVCHADSDEAKIVEQFTGRPLVVSVGRFGKYVGKLDIALDDSGLKYKYTPVAITEDLLREKTLVDLYRVYQLVVKEEKLLENAPRIPLPSSLEYVGSKACKPCHAYEYSKWSAKKHAHAYATLEKAGSEYDPECVICHTVGLEYDGGFISKEKTPHFKDVPTATPPTRAPTMPETSKSTYNKLFTGGNQTLLPMSNSKDIY